MKYKKPMSFINFRVEPSTKEKLLELAKKNDLTISEMLRKIVLDYLNEENK